MDTNISREMIKSAVTEALFEAGLTKDMINFTKASKLLSRRLVENGIKSGDLNFICSGKGNAVRLIPMSDIIRYKNKLLERGKIKS